MRRPSLDHFSRRISNIFLTCLFVVSISSCNTDSSTELQLSNLKPLVNRVSRPTKILFLGNSFTYFNDGVDRHLHRLVSAAFPTQEFVFDSLTVPNRTVKGHYQDVTTTEALSSERWDLVVIQGASHEPARTESIPEFNEYTTRLAERIREEGAEVALFMTWAYRFDREMLLTLASTYVETGNRISALVVPVGMAWEKIRQQQSGGFLFSDTRHPSLPGTYLAACVFFAAIFSESPEGSAYTGGLPPDQARFLQEIAWQTTRTFYSDS